MVKTTRQQREALARVYARDWNAKPATYREFRQTVQPEICGSAIMVHWCNMWLGIEPDGYTHS